MANSTETATTEVPVKKISEEDKLHIENLQLKLQNCALQEERLARELNSCHETTVKIQKDIIELRNKLGEKYGVDFTKTRILPDGRLIEPGVPDKAS